MKYRKLRGLIREKYGTQAAFAAAMGMSNTTLSAKLNGKTDWVRAEMEQACRLLGISAEVIPAYFEFHTKFFAHECARTHKEEAVGHGKANR